MGKVKKNVSNSDRKDSDIREESEASDIRTDFPLCEKDEIQQSIMRTKKAHEKSKKVKPETEDNPLSE